MNINKQALRQTAEKAQEHGVFNMDIHSETVLALLDELEAAGKRNAELEARKAAPPEGYVLAPAKANMAMIRAGGQAARKYLEEHGGNSPQVIYQAMIAAAGISINGEG